MMESVIAFFDLELTALRLLEYSFLLITHDICCYSKLLSVNGKSSKNSSRICKLLFTYLTWFFSHFSQNKKGVTTHFLSCCHPMCPLDQLPAHFYLKMDATPTVFSSFSREWEELFLQTKLLGAGSSLGHLCMKKFSVGPTELALKLDKGRVLGRGGGNFFHLFFNH